ncbi:hypothetical protein JCM33374_g1372 [Metschnikowia sp. JCM 33374]|nr:hypothetical protein JCM33374_g1372 [Metschnikowia sp. JCM 33374]
MNVLAFLAFFTVAFSQDTIGIGTLYITNSGDSTVDVTKIRYHPEHKSLVTTGEKVVVSSQMSIFEYYSKVGIRQISTRKYLGIGTDGRFKVVRRGAKKPFEVIEDAERPGRKVLAVEGNKEFQLCGDGQIAYNSDCEASQKIHIVYKEFL